MWVSTVSVNDSDYCMSSDFILITAAVLTVRQKKKKPKPFTMSLADEIKVRNFPDFSNFHRSV